MPLRVESALGIRVTHPPDDSGQYECGDHVHAQYRDGRVPPAPPPRAAGPRLAPRLDRPVFDERLQVAGEFARADVPAVRLACHRLQHDGFEIARDVRVQLPRRCRVGVGHLLDEPGRAFHLIRRPEREQFVQRCAEAVHVAPRVGVAEQAFRGEVLQRAEDVAGRGEAVQVRRASRGRSPRPTRARLGRGSGSPASRRGAVRPACARSAAHRRLEARPPRRTPSRRTAGRGPSAHRERRPLGLSRGACRPSAVFDG